MIIKLMSFSLYRLGDPWIITATTAIKKKIKKKRQKEKNRAREKRF